MKGLVKKIRSSVSAQAAVVVTLPVVIILTLQSYIEYREDRDRLLGHTEMQLLRVAEGLKGPAETFAENKDRKGLEHLVDESARGADIELIAVYDPRGLVVASNKKKWVGKPMLAMHPEDITEADIAAIRKGFEGGYSAYYDPDDMQYCLVMPVDYAPAGTGAMHISLDLSSLAADIKKSAVRISLGSVFVASLIGITIYFFFHSLITLRIKNVSAAAMKLAAGDLAARTRAWGTDEIGYLATSFNVLAEEMEKWKNHLEEMVEFRVRDLSVLYSVVEATSQSLDLDTILPVVLQRVLRVMGEERGLVFIRDERTGAVRLAAHQGFSPESIRAIQDLKPGEGCAGFVMARNQTIRIGDAAAGKDVTILPGLEREGIRSAIAAPISFQQKNLGAIAVYSRKADRFSENDEELFQSIGSQVGVAVENSLLYTRTLELACEDGLTGLANRRYFMETLEREASRAARYKTPFTVLITDLDLFKQFNDTYGHLKGDELLRSFASLLERSLRTSDIAGRYGGEEFAVILPNTPLQGGLVTAERIRKACEELRVRVGEGRVAGTTVSIGAAEFQEGKTMEALLQAADTALYRAKADGRNRVAGREERGDREQAS